MSTRMRIAVCLLAVSALAGCAGLKPAYNECGGNNCRKGPGREALDVVEAEPVGGATTIG